ERRALAGAGVHPERQDEPDPPGRHPRRLEVRPDLADDPLPLGVLGGTVGARQHAVVTGDLERERRRLDALRLDGRRRGLGRRHPLRFVARTLGPRPRRPARPRRQGHHHQGEEQVGEQPAGEGDDVGVLALLPHAAGGSASRSRSISSASCRKDSTSWPTSAPSASRSSRTVPMLNSTLALAFRRCSATDCSLAAAPSIAALARPSASPVDDTEASSAALARPSASLVDDTVVSKAEPADCRFVLTPVIAAVASPTCATSFSTAEVRLACASRAASASSTTRRLSSRAEVAAALDRWASCSSAWRSWPVEVTTCSSDARVLLLSSCTAAWSAKSVSSRSRSCASLSVNSFTWAVRASIWSPIVALA